MLSPEEEFPAYQNYTAVTLRCAWETRLTEPALSLHPIGRGLLGFPVIPVYHYSSVILALLGRGLLFVSHFCQDWQALYLQHYFLKCLRCSSKAVAFMHNLPLTRTGFLPGLARSALQLHIQPANPVFNPASATSAAEYIRHFPLALSGGKFFHSKARLVLLYIVHRPK